MPLSINPVDRIVLSWDMFKKVHDIRDIHGRKMDASTKCTFKINWSKNQVNVTFTDIKLKVRIDINKTEALLKHEQGHADISWLSGNATGLAILEDMRSGNFLVKKHENLQKKLQKLYDDETEHSENLQNQQYWNHSLDVAIFYRYINVVGSPL